MTSFDQYEHRYEHVRFTRQQSVLEIALHSDGGSYVHNRRGHQELPSAFWDVGSDPENRVVILTGSGDRFCTDIDARSFPSGAGAWYDTFWQGKHLLTAFLDTEVPVIGVVNGPAYIHSELLLLSNIVIAAPTASFRDDRLRMGGVPGDGMRVVVPLLLGEIRGRYFLLTGQEIDARQALEYGLVNEIAGPGEAQATPCRTAGAAPAAGRGRQAGAALVEPGEASAGTER
jgi:enoyl-CoA hydratase/carnithine racemase